MMYKKTAIYLTSVEVDPAVTGRFSIAIKTLKLFLSNLTIS